jgi:hypothetical protein
MPENINGKGRFRSSTPMPITHTAIFDIAKSVPNEHFPQQINENLPKGPRKALTPHNVCNARAPTPRKALTPHNVCNARAPTPLSQFWERADKVTRSEGRERGEGR